MYRFIIILISSFSFFAGAMASPIALQKEMARDLTGILTSKKDIENLSGTGRTYVAFSQKYLKNLEGFYQRYATPFHILALRPTIDRSLSYHLRIQQYSLSCEITAVQIILGSLGIKVTENDIFAKIPLYQYIYASGGIWGDPDKQFVGYYTGGQTKKTGYGIYEKPLADYVGTYGYRTKILNQLMYSGSINPENHMMELLQNLNNKRTHIILWGDWCTNPIYEDGVLSKGGKWILEFFPLPGKNHCDRTSDKRMLKWKTPEGKDIIGLSGEHAFILLGYIGTPKKPSHIIVWDTYTGRHVYPYSEWMRKWSLMQYRSLVVSSKK